MLNMTRLLDHLTVSLKLGVHRTIWACFWPGFWATWLILESDWISASSGIVQWGEWGGIMARPTAPDWPSNDLVNFWHVRNSSWPLSGSREVEAEPWVDSLRLVGFCPHCTCSEWQTERWKCQGDMVRNVDKLCRQGLSSCGNSIHASSFCHDWYIWEKYWQEIAAERGNQNLDLTLTPNAFWGHMYVWEVQREIYSKPCKLDKRNTGPYR